MRGWNFPLFFFRSSYLKVRAKNCMSHRLRWSWHFFNKTRRAQKEVLQSAFLVGFQHFVRIVTKTSAITFGNEDVIWVSEHWSPLSSCLFKTGGLIHELLILRNIGVASVIQKFTVLPIVLVFPIDYRCDNRRFCLSAHDRQAPTRTSQNLATRTANSNFWSRLTHQFLGRLKSTIPNLQIYLPKKRILRSWGWGLTIHACYLFWVCGRTSAWRGLMTGIFGILESSATQWHQDVAPTRESSIVYL